MVRGDRGSAAVASEVGARDIARIKSDSGHLISWIHHSTLSGSYLLFDIA